MQDADLPFASIDARPGAIMRRAPAGRLPLEGNARIRQPPVDLSAGRALPDNPCKQHAKWEPAAEHQRMAIFINRLEQKTTALRKKLPALYLEKILRMAA